MRAATTLKTSVGGCLSVVLEEVRSLDIHVQGVRQLRSGSCE